MLRNDIQRVLTAYLQQFPEDAATVADLQSLMDAGAAVCSSLCPAGWSRGIAILAP
jgi:hypothetical protein